MHNVNKMLIPIPPIRAPPCVPIHLPSSRASYRPETRGYSPTNFHFVLYFHAPPPLQSPKNNKTNGICSQETTTPPTPTTAAAPSAGTTTTAGATSTTGPPTINRDSAATETALHLNQNQNQIRQSSVRVASSNTSSSEQLGYSLAHLTKPNERQAKQPHQPNSKSCELIVLPFSAQQQQQLQQQQQQQPSPGRVELRRNRSLNEQTSSSVTINATSNQQQQQQQQPRSSPQWAGIRTTSHGGVSLKLLSSSRQNSVDNYNYERAGGGGGGGARASRVDVGTHNIVTVDGHQQQQLQQHSTAVPSITVDVGAASDNNNSNNNRKAADCSSPLQQQQTTEEVETPGKLQQSPCDVINTTTKNKGRELKVLKHKPIISTSFDCAGQYDDPYFHRYDDENQRLDDNEEKRLFPVKLEPKAKLQSNSDIILRNHSYKSCVKRKSNHSTGNLDDLFNSLRASGDHQPQFAYYYLDDCGGVITSSSSHSTSPSAAAAAAAAAVSSTGLINSTTHSHCVSSLHPHSHPLTGVVVVGRQTESATTTAAGGHVKHSLSKSLNCLRKRSAKLKFHLKPLKIAQITSDSDSISISNCQVPITLAQYGNAASSSSLSTSPLSVCNGQQQQQQQQYSHQPSYVPSGAASSGSSPNRYSATLPKLGGSLNRPRLNSSDSHKVHEKHKSKPVHHHSHQEPICAAATVFELTSKSSSVVPRPVVNHQSHRHSVAVTGTSAQPPKHLSTQSLTTACWSPTANQHPSGTQQFSGGGGSSLNNKVNSNATSDSGGGNNNNSGSNGSGYNNNNNPNSANGASSSSYYSAAASQVRIGKIGIFKL